MEWHNCFSAQRLGAERTTVDPRTAYERDYDRLIFSAPFRRLQGKTQVFPLPERVFVHNRLTHSLEVVSVGRSLGTEVGGRLAERPELAGHPEAQVFYRHQLRTVLSAACLAHDIGNPAFGHAGEDAISRYFREREGDTAFSGQFTAAQWRDLTRFEGNANAFRLLTRHFPGRLPGGFQLTYTTLASMLKYPCESTGQDKKAGKHRSKYGYFQSDAAAFDRLLKELPLAEDSARPRAHFRHPFVYLVEAADDICYTVMDYEDGHRLGILSFEELKGDFWELLEAAGTVDMHQVNLHLERLREDKEEAVAYLRAKVIGALVSACVAVFMEESPAILAGRYGQSLLEGAPEFKDVLGKIEKKSFQRIYNHESVVKIELAGFEIMSGLIADLVEAATLPPERRHKRHQKVLGLMPRPYQVAGSPYEKIMGVLDYVSSMTDPYALELYRHLRGISIPGL
ncbi:MAG: dNTP triphosphohydrolase, partial [Schleiferiaceae bacterium]|nr:dNTP triphosphohydrolase [Schleiferiaceae bacterium]